MKKKTFLGTVLIILLCMKMFPINVRGKIKLIDDKTPPGEYNSILNTIVCFTYICACFIKADGRIENYANTFSVNESGDFVLSIDDAQIFTSNPTIRIQFSTTFAPYDRPLGWKDKNPECDHTLNCIVLENGRDNYNVDICIVHPFQPSPQIRERNYNLGVANYSSSPKLSKLYFTEAAIGNNLDYIAKAAGFLEEHGQQSMVHEVLESFDIETISDDNTRCKLYARLANSQRADGLVIDALKNYAEALIINPKNSILVSMAYTVVKNEIKAKGFTDLKTKISDFPEINKEFIPIYENWEIQNKPALQVTGKIMDLENWAFAAKNIKNINNELN